ncbi:MAG TPA: DUF6166 domain-containing protein [Verrucomicrobiae bacterium]|nr:DUF6166 domain-containing protein [Verrucomicrobiae bacterium]
MKRYVGMRMGSAVDVTVDGRPLRLRLDLWNHSPSGFEWGYDGSGPAQLALALLADCYGDDEVAVEWHQDFKSAVVAGLPYNGWTFTEEEIREMAHALRDN